MADKNKQKWILTHDSHALKKGEIFEGETLPAWLQGKATPLAADSFEVATPGGAVLEKLQADLAAETKRADDAVAAQAKAAEDHAAALAAETKRADDAVAAQAKAAEDHAAALAAETKRADDAEAALKAATSKAK